MRTREKPLHIRKWANTAFPWSLGVLQYNETERFLGYWLDTHVIHDYRLDGDAGHGVDHYFQRFQQYLSSCDDLCDYLQPYPPYRHTASGRKTLLVSGIHDECPFCIVLQENEEGVCHFMDILFPSTIAELRLFIHDLESYLELVPLPLPIPHKVNFIVCDTKSHKPLKNW